MPFVRLEVNMIAGTAPIAVSTMVVPFRTVCRNFIDVHNVVLTRMYQSDSRRALELFHRLPVGDCGMQLHMLRFIIAGQRFRPKRFLRRTPKFGKWSYSASFARASFASASYSLLSNVLGAKAPLGVFPGEYESYLIHNA